MPMDAMRIDDPPYVKLPSRLSYSAADHLINQEPDFVRN